MSSELINLHVEIKSNTSEIKTEEVARKVVDLGLQNQITSNDADILNLQTDLGTETTNRTNGDTNLGSRITTNDTDILNIQNNHQNAILFSGLQNLRSNVADHWLIPFNGNEGTQAHGTLSGRYYFPSAVEITKIAVIGDDECFNTFLTGSYTIQLWTENLNQGTSGLLIYQSSIHGRNSVNQPRMVTINSGLDPDNSSTSGISNTICLISVSLLVAADFTMSVKIINLSNLDAVGMEIQHFVYYRYQ